MVTGLCLRKKVPLPVMHETSTLPMWQQMYQMTMLPIQSGDWQPQDDIHTDDIEQVQAHQR